MNSMFPYPINETLGIGDVDPADIRRVGDEWVYDPGWWREIPERVKEAKQILKERKK